MNFTDWDYDTGIATEYRRDGECSKCGDCCKVIIKLQMVGGDKDSYGGYATDGEKRWSEILGGEDREFVRFFSTDEPVEERCSALGPDNLCSLNGTKPWRCQVWPTSPSDIALFSNCTYKFIEVDNWELEIKDEQS